MSVNSSQEEGGESGVWLRVRSLELAGLQFEHHRARNPRFFARGGPNLFCEATDHWLGFGQKNVMLESILSGYGLRWPVRNDFTVVDAAREFV